LKTISANTTLRGANKKYGIQLNITTVSFLKILKTISANTTLRGANKKYGIQLNITTVSFSKILKTISANTTIRGAKKVQYTIKYHNGKLFKNFENHQRKYNPQRRK
jgi:hypothetical protein